MKIKGKKTSENIKKDAGSITVEMCLIFPIVVWSVFFVIYLFVGELNRGAATGEVYEKLYNREAYIFYNNGQGVFEEVLKENIDLALKQSIAFLGNLETTVVFNNSDHQVLHNLEQFYAGNLQISVWYEEQFPGISYMIKDTDAGQTITGSQEIRDTSNNLRRWQIYGQVLSD